MQGDFDDLTRDLGLDATGSDLREQWRLEEEEYTRAAEQHWSHRRTMRDIATELMHRGDTVAMTIATVTFTGAVVAVGNDYLQLATSSGIVDVRVTDVPTAVRVVERRPVGGCRIAPGSPTFRARLLEREIEGGEVVVGSWCSAEHHRGAIRVGRDQVRITGTETDAYLAMSWIAWVRSGRGPGKA